MIERIDGKGKREGEGNDEKEGGTERGWERGRGRGRCDGERGGGGEERDQVTDLREGLVVVSKHHGTSRIHSTDTGQLLQDLGVECPVSLPVPTPEGVDTQV